jgi:hypothetical protein
MVSSLAGEAMSSLSPLNRSGGEGESQTESKYGCRATTMSHHLIQSQPDPETTGRKQRQSQFQSGQSGNPSGRPPGARNKTTLAVEALLDGEAEVLTRKAIELAKAGDLVALRLCLDRVCPPRRDRPVRFTLPELKTAEDAKLAASALLKAVADGDLTPSEASEIGRLLDSYTRILEREEFEKRLIRLEEKATQ